MGPQGFFADLFFFIIAFIYCWFICALCDKWKLTGWKWWGVYLGFTLPLPVVSVVINVLS